MKQVCGIIILLFLATLLGGCADLLGTAPPTPYPTWYIPTVVAMTVEAGRQATATPTSSSTPTLSQIQPASPTATRTAGSSILSTNTSRPTTRPTSSRTPTGSLPPTTTSTLRTPSFTPTPTRLPSKTPTSTPTPGIPAASVEISSPGPMSKVISPLEVAATLKIVPGGYWVMELLIPPLSDGEEPRSLYRSVKKFYTDTSGWIYVTDEIEFDLLTAGESAQLRISTYDTHNRPVAVASADLLLLKYGESELTPSGDLSEPIVIREPTTNKLIQGGSLLVSGLAFPSGDQILHINLVTNDNKIVGTRDIFLIPTEGNPYTSFSGIVTYQVTDPTWVRMIVYEYNVRVLPYPAISGYRQLSSVEVLLSP